MYLLRSKLIFYADQPSENMRRLGPYAGSNVMLNKYLCLITLVLGTAAVLFGQDTFKPRDGNEALAMRLHDWYVQSQTRLTNLRNELPRADSNSRQFINVPGDREDLDRFNQIKADIEREQIWS